MSEWLEKGATLSDKSAETEFGLTRVQIVQAIQSGQLHYREGNAHGNPYFRLLRREVSALATATRGEPAVEQRRKDFELKKIDTEVRRLKRQIAMLQERRALLAG